MIQVRLFFLLLQMPSAFTTDERESLSAPGFSRSPPVPAAWRYRSLEEGEIAPFAAASPPRSRTPAIFEMSQRPATKWEKGFQKAGRSPG